jgi:hypothetical protein
MSGVINVEGQSEGALHPVLGEVKTNALARRSLQDFPPVAWFTTQINVPRCLIETTLFFEDKSGRKREVSLSSDEAHAMALNRVALGFPVSDIPVVPWPEHRGYSTAEGQDLNASARAAGDNPDDWWVSEEPVDLMKMSEIWTAPRISSPKMLRNERYLADVRKMVAMCRSTPGVFIPPTWLTQEQGAELARRLGKPVAGLV